MPAHGQRNSSANSALITNRRPGPKSELYVDLLPLINSRRIELVDDARLLNQLCALERRTARGGRDSIDHPPGAHDDICNAVAGLASINDRCSYNSFIV